MSDNSWIRVEDRLPEPYEKVLAFHRGLNEWTIRLEWLTCLGNDWIFAQLYGPVTHWMPLPEPPKEADNVDHK